MRAKAIEGLSVQIVVSDRWPRIGCALRVDADGTVEDDFTEWLWETSGTLSPDDRAAAYEEWADFFQWRLAQRADELADDQGLRRMAEKWTDSMVYCCRRLAAWARGDNPGKPVPQCERRPDLCGVGT